MNKFMVMIVIGGVLGGCASEPLIVEHINTHDYTLSYSHKTFDTEIEAVKEVIALYNGIAIDKNKLFEGYVYRNSLGRHYYSVTESGKLPPTYEAQNVVAIWQSYGHRQWGHDYFSPDIKQLAIDARVRVYRINSDNLLHIYNPSGTVDYLSME